MRTKAYTALASCVVFALVFLEPAGAFANHDGHRHQNNQQVTKRARQRAKAKKKMSRRAVSYVCPMHPDIREKARGTCPKCLMDLVAEPLGEKAGSDAKDKARRAREGAPTVQGMRDRER